MALALIDSRFHKAAGREAADMRAGSATVPLAGAREEPHRDTAGAAGAVAAAAEQGSMRSSNMTVYLHFRWRTCRELRRGRPVVVEGSGKMTVGEQMAVEGTTPVVAEIGRNTDEKV